MADVNPEMEREKEVLGSWNDDEMEGEGDDEVIRLGLDAIEGLMIVNVVVVLLLLLFRGCGCAVPLTCPGLSVL